MRILKKRWKLILSILVLLLLGLFFWNRSQAKNSTLSQTKIFTVKRTTLTRTISASGKIRAEKEVELKFSTSGLLTWVGVKEGDTVKPYQILASLDRRELQKKLEKALRDYSKERWDFEEDRTTTYKDKLVTDTAKRILEKNQFDLDKSILDVELADIALQFASLTSPIGGIVTKIDVPLAGVNITPAGAVFTISDPESVYFRAEIDETDISNIKIGQKVSLFLDAYSQEKIPGKIYRIGFSSTTTSGGGNAYPVKISLPKNKNLKFKLGMNGDADIIQFEKKNVLAIPLESIIRKSGKTYVEVIEEDKINEREIKIGTEANDQIEVKKGLNEKDRIIIKS